MPISAACRCGRRFMAKDELGGKTVQCPACGQAFRVPLGATATVAAAPQVPQPAPQTPKPTPQAPKVVVEYVSPYEALGPTSADKGVPSQSVPQYQLASSSPFAATPRRRSHAPVLIVVGLVGLLAVGGLALLVIVGVGLTRSSGGPSSANASSDSSLPIRPTPTPGHPGFADRAATSAWQIHRSAAGRYTVEMPGRPAPARNQQATAAGSITIHTATLERPDGSAYVVSYSDFPPLPTANVDVSAILDNSVTGMLQGMNAHPVSQTPISLDGYPGRKVSAEVSGTQPLDVRARLFLVNSRLYQVIWAQPKGTIPEGEVRRFLGSFRLQGTPPPDSRSPSPPIVSTPSSPAPEPPTPLSQVPSMRPPSSRPPSLGPPRFTLPSFGARSPQDREKQIYRRAKMRLQIVERLRESSAHFPSGGGRARQSDHIQMIDQQIRKSLCRQYDISQSELDAILAKGDGEDWPH